jgi:hypothetical protein
MSETPSPAQIIEACRLSLDSPEGTTPDVLGACRALIAWADDPARDPAAAEPLYTNVIQALGAQVGSILEGVHQAIRARPAPGDEGQAH